MTIDKARGIINKHLHPIVWTLRILVGATFAFSGFAKAVDPWGFIIKLSEYLSAWHMQAMPDEALLCVAGAISIGEFVVGTLLLLGCMRQVAAWLAFLAMCVMLPLTAYIAIADPVDDCGCFGDALKLSNTATFVKNIFLFAFTFFLGRTNHKVPGVYPHIMQWLVVIASMAYAMILVIVGYFVQPMVDFRPYKVGTPITASTAEDDVMMVYEKDGVERRFGLDELPDSTWTFVGREEGHAEGEGKLLAVFDGHDDVTPYVFEEEGPQLVLVVNNPEAHNRARASMANKLNDYVQRQGGSMIGIVAIQPEGLQWWKELATPDFEVYCAEDTSLKELARGDAALVYLKDGIIQWKRNIFSFDADFPDYDFPGNALEEVYIPDSGRWIKAWTLFYLAFLLIVWIPCAPFVLRRKKNGA
ncbi:MAG: DoxX family protein [Clostridium sp.]|nr:DoxX family protein [Clostridium sp.]